MDNWLLKQTDRFGDWWQEERGGVLPKLLYAMTAIMAFIEGVWCLSIISTVLSEPGWVLLTLALVWLTVFTLVNIPTPAKLRAYQADFDRFDDPEVRKKYQDKAMMWRYVGNYHRWWFLFVSPMLVWLNVSDMISEGFVELNNLAPALFFSVALIKGYVDCIIPKAPNVRRELKLATVST